ncbi:hypothetical protein CH063_06038 [Colletotrichum higginsianum]|uniref:Uncharacterized protein n=1 Tax=Colletotrichum higginsianum (strain IMI 349063) TaxID=759273 RepID=H1V144_COLHI|nr:hypothetical protein CH63R_11311 [Colletotrichum higginsianum IMI 349063]OBR04608.1 hypothetical protein CH63R_11311 [Colletotrichum higginsianum IMI 349063]CCF33945.1 hypothetical protein CH063_06038 [Colletotrichum higginsianum]
MSPRRISANGYAHDGGYEAIPLPQLSRNVEQGQTDDVDIDETRSIRLRMMRPIARTKRKKLIWKRTILGFRCFFGVGIVLNAAFQIMLAFTDSKDFEVDSPNFPLYKNTRYGTCPTVGMESVDCTEFTNLTYTESARTWALRAHGPLGSMEGLCEAVYCLQGFKIVPSVPLEAAFRQGSLGLWLAINIAATAAFEFLKSEATFEQHLPEDCKDRPVLNWTILTRCYTLASFFLWWYGYHIFNTSTTNIQPIGAFAWLTTWRFANNFHHHPVRCAFHRWPILSKVVFAALYVLAIAQWIACARVFTTTTGLMFAERTPGGYQCLEEQIDAAPRSSPCSPAEICAIERLFVAQDFDVERTDFRWYPLLVLTFCLLSFAAAADVVWSIGFEVSVCGGWAGGPYCCQDDIFDVFPLSHLTDFALTMLSIAYFVIGVREAVGSLLYDDRESRILVDVACRAVHFEMSSWRQFLDVKWNMAWRFTKLWLNA